MRATPPITLAGLGFDEAAIESLTGGPGLILIAGRTGSGKNKILQALMRHLAGASDQGQARHVLNPDQDEIQGALLEIGAGRRVIVSVHASGAAEAILVLLRVFPAEQRDNMAQRLCAGLRVAVHQDLEHLGGGTFQVAREFLHMEAALRGKLTNGTDRLAILKEVIVAESFILNPYGTLNDAAKQLARLAVTEAVRMQLKGQNAGPADAQPLADTALRLAEAMKTFPVGTHTQRLEMVARAFGFRNWHAAQGRV